MEVRRGEITDLTAINKMAWEVFPHTYSSILTKDQIDYMMEWMYSLENLEKQIVNEGHIYFLATEGGKEIGYFSIQQQDVDLFHLQKIYLLPPYQGRGYGKLLFNEAIAQIHSMHPAPCKIELNVNRYNKAVGFYHKMGMKIKCSVDFDIGNGYFMNDYIMTIDVK